MEPLPDGTHLIHIGPPKTGSTSLQTALFRSRKALAELGVAYPGARRKPDGQLGIQPNDHDRDLDVEQLPAWQQLRRQVARASASSRLVVVSREGFARLWPERIHELVRDVGGEQPHVVYVARRLDKLMPSYWQQRVKRSGITMTYDEWLEMVLEPGGVDPSARHQEWHNFWSGNDLVAVVRRWAEATGPGRFTLIVPPDGDRDLMPDTFADLLGVPRDLMRAEVGSANQSLTLAEAELVRRLNERTIELGWSTRRRHNWVREAVVRSLVQAETPPGQARIPLPPDWVVDRLHELVDEQIGLLQQLRDTHGLQVVGDLGALRVPAPVRASGDPADPQDAETSAVATDDLTSLPLESVMAAVEALCATATARHEARLARVDPDAEDGVVARATDADADADSDDAEGSGAVRGLLRRVRGGQR